jgi:large subunit ribosomal protein L29
MKQKEITQLSVSELQDRLVTEQGQLEKLKLSHGVSPVENPLMIRTTRRIIARIKTEMTKRVNEGKKN